VAAAGVNGADLRERQGKYPVPAGAPDLMGLEVSGEVVKVGPNCDRKMKQNPFVEPYKK
jgi:NADPH2:quinone reductase